MLAVSMGKSIFKHAVVVADNCGQLSMQVKKRICSRQSKSRRAGLSLIIPCLLIVSPYDLANFGLREPILS